MIFAQILFFAASLPLVAASHRHGRKGHRGMETCEFYDPVPGQKAYDTNRKLSEEAFQFDKRATRSVDITVNLHAAVPGNASCDFVSRDQIYKQYEVLRDECTNLPFFTKRSSPWLLSEVVTLLPSLPPSSNVLFRQAIWIQHDSGRHHPHP